MPEWGSLDILEACGASDLGSNPSSGASIHQVREFGAHRSLSIIAFMRSDSSFVTSAVFGRLSISLAFS